MTGDKEPAERIAKRLARAGLCSRREAERWIEAGRVSVNGATLQSAAVNVGPGDKITVDGKEIPTIERPRLWRYHKPAGLVTTHRDEKGRETVFEKLPEDLPRVISVGRLDLNSEGLLLLTNDGELARRLELPATGWKRKYRVRVHGHPNDADMQKLAKGLTIDGVKYGSIEGTIDSSKGANSWLTLSLREGKNREVRKVLEHLGYPVSRLIRISYGPLQLSDLPVGAVEEVKAKILRDQMGVAKFEEEEPAEPRGKGQRPQRKGAAPRTTGDKRGPVTASKAPAKGGGGTAAKRPTLRAKPAAVRSRKS